MSTPFARRLRIHLLLLLWVTIALPGFASADPIKERIKGSLLLATTTSLRDSGLLDALLPEFTSQTGIRVRVIAVGTGAALRMGREGNADVLLTHAPTAEEALVADGTVRRRTPLMQNYFVIAGPSDDPAAVANSESPEAAIASIAAGKFRWISRADDSGTHKREIQLFAAAGFDKDVEWPGLSRTGTGMGLSLQVAGERRAYILSDIGTFLAFEKRTGLRALSKPSDALRNTYSILQLDGARFDHSIRSNEAEALERYFRDPATRSEIAEFGREKFGRALFTPLDVGAAKGAGNDSPPEATAPVSEGH